MLEDGFYIHLGYGVFGDIAFLQFLLVLGVLFYSYTHGLHVGDYGLDAFLMPALGDQKVQDPGLLAIHVSPDEGDQIWAVQVSAHFI